MSVRKIPNSPFWHYDFWYRGRRYKGTTKQSTKLRAQDYERRVRYQLEHGHDPFTRSPLVSDLLSQYLGWLEVNRSLDHLDRSRRAMKNVFDRMRGVKTADQITPSRIEDFKNRRRKEVSVSTVNLELRHFKSFLRRCVRQGWLSAVPVEIEQVKSRERGRVVFLSEDDVNPFLDKLRPWARAVARFILLTGLRLEEARFLEWQDVDLDLGILWVRNKPEVGFSPKNGKERSVSLPPQLVEELRPRQQKTGWVLPGEKVGQFDRRTFQDTVATAARKAGLEKPVTPHTLRHSYGAALAMRGVPLPTIQSLMGHASISTTMIYIHLTEDHRREAVAKLSLPHREEREEKVIPLRGRTRPTA